MKGNEENIKKASFLDPFFTKEGLFFWIYCVFLIFYLGELKLPLSYDEAYYWDWSRTLDFGYYSKPPMVAWLIALSSKLLGATEFGVRAPALILRLLSLALSFLVLFRYFGQERARLFFYTFAFAPLFLLYSFVITIDPPLFFFWILSLISSSLFLERQTHLRALLLGLCMGLGLLTKQTMLAFPFLLFLYLFLWERKLLFSPRTYLSFITAFLIYLPNLLWNFTHELVMIKHTEEHFLRLFPKKEAILLFLGGLHFLYGPIFVPLSFYFSGKYLKLLINHRLKKEKISPEEKRLPLKLLNLYFFFSFPPLFLLFLLSFFIEMNLNWVAPFFISAYFFVTILALQKKTYFVLAKLNLLISLILSLFLLALPQRPDLFPPKLVQVLNKFYGGPELARVVEKYYQREVPLLTTGRDLASWLAFYLKEKPRPYVLKINPFPENQYHLWLDPETLRGKRVLLVKKGEDPPQYLKYPSHLETLRLEFYGKKRTYSLWLGVYNGINL